MFGWLLRRQDVVKEFLKSSRFLAGKGTKHGPSYSLVLSTPYWYQLLLFLTALVHTVLQFFQKIRMGTEIVWERPFWAAQVAMPSNRTAPSLFIAKGEWAGLWRLPMQLEVYSCSVYWGTWPRASFERERLSFGILQTLGQSKSNTAFHKLGGKFLYTFRKQCQCWELMFQTSCLPSSQMCIDPTC